MRGIRFQGSTGETSKRKALQVEARIRAQIEAEQTGQKPTNLTLTLNYAAGRYMAEHGELLASWRAVESRLGKLIETFGADTQLHQLTDERIAQAVTHWRRQDKSAQTINHYLGLLKRVLDRADDFWQAKIGPARRWKLHRQPVGQPIERELSELEQQRLVKVLQETDPELLDLVTFALLTGKRSAALRGLTWDDVDLEAGLMTFREKTQLKEELHRLPITAPIRQFLEAKQGQHPVYVITYTCIKTNRRNGVVEGQRYPFSQDGWRKRWYAALEAARIEKFRFHDLRHTFASRVTRNTRNLTITQDLLNHKDITTTQRYAHVLDTDRASALADESLAPKVQAGKARPKPERRRKVTAKLLQNETQDDITA